MGTTFLQVTKCAKFCSIHHINIFTGVDQVEGNITTDIDIDDLGTLKIVNSPFDYNSDF